MSLNKNDEKQSRDGISDLLSGEIEALDQIFMDEEVSKKMLDSKKEYEQIMIETAAIGKSFSGQKIAVDSSGIVDSNFIFSVTKKMSSLGPKFLAPRKPDSLKTRVTEHRELFSEIAEMTNDLKTWTENLDSIAEIVLEESDKDLLVRHHASILEAIRLDEEIQLLTKDLNILKEALR